MKLTNIHGIPETIVRAVTRDPYTKGEADFSATELIKPPQIGWLSRKYPEAVEADVSDRIWALLGKAVHTILEDHAQDNHTVEERLYRTITVEGTEYTVSGAIDVQDGDRAIRDWKTVGTGTVMYGEQPKPDWVKQLNIYQWLIGETRQLEIVTIFRDWSKAEARRKESRGYPQAPVQIIPIPSWGLEETEAYIRERIYLHTAERPDRCTDEETWRGRRCESYCEVASICPQYAGLD